MACFVDFSGMFRSCSINNIAYDSGIVRPALWVNLDSSGDPGIVNAYLGEKAAPSAPAANKTNCSTVGNFVTFGSYEQDDSPENGPEAIEWIVMDVQGGKALLLSRYGLDAKQYNTESGELLSWETCTLRAWLNKDFLNSAFSAAEQSAILLTRVDNSSPNGDSTGSSDTDDRLFLFSQTEAAQYYGIGYVMSNWESVVTPTTYASLEGAGFAWWLRSHGYNAVGVTSSGSINIISVDEKLTVRPAFWIDLNSDILAP